MKKRAPAQTKEGIFPFYRYTARYDIWDYIPMDQGGRFVQLQIIGSENDLPIIATVTRPGFFDPWGQPVVWDSLEETEVEKSCWLNRWYFLPSFARLYFITGERHHLSFVVNFVRRWMSENPLPHDLPKYFLKGTHNWCDMQVAWRTQNLIWGYFLGREALTRKERSEWRKYIAAHGRVLLAWFGQQPLHENNHQSHGALAMLMVGVLFPSFSQAAALRRKALQILDHHLEHAFYPDGNSIELCPGYYPFFTAIFRDAWLLCEENGVRLPKRIKERLRQFHHYMSTMQQPDGNMPPINDSSESATGTSLRVLGNLLQLSETQKPESHCFPDSHQAVMRDGGQPEMYLLADAGPLILGHWHGGKLGFHFWASGRPWLVDSGVCNYDDPLRLSWFTAPDSHNTLLVDGEGDYRRTDLDFAAKADATTRIVSWVSTDTHDYTAMRHRGFRLRKAPVDWIRHIVMVKGLGVILVDEVASKTIHEYIWPLHFAPCRLTIDSQKTQALATDGIKRLWIATNPAGGAVSLQKKRGIISQRGRNISAPILNVKIDAARAVMATALLPAIGRRRHAPTVSTKIVRGTIRVRIETPDQTAVISLPSFLPSKSPKSTAAISIKISANRSKGTTQNES